MARFAMEFPDFHSEISIELSRWKSGNSMGKRAISPDFHLIQLMIKYSLKAVSL